MDLLGIIMILILTVLEFSFLVFFKDSSAV